jgi:hypothetical protein
MPFQNRVPRRLSAARNALPFRYATTGRPERRSRRSRPLARLSTWRRWLAAMLAALTANIAIGFASCAVLYSATGAELDTGYAGEIVAPYQAAPGAERPRAHVQPHAWEFAPPYGKPDLSAEKGRVVDQLYDNLMRGILPSCSRLSVTTTRQDRC